MRNVFFAIVFCMLANASTAQGLDFGLKIGANALKLDDVAFDKGFNWGYLGGAYLHVNLSKKFGVGGELLFSQAVSKPGANFNDIIGGLPSGTELGNLKLQYLSIPLMLNFGRKFKLQLGVQYSIKMNEKETLGTNINNVFKSTDFQALGGFHWKLPLHLFASGRYLVGLSNISDITASNKWNSQTIQISTGLNF